MVEEQTTIAVQRYPDDLGGDATNEPVVREILTRSARRLQVLCGNLLYREYPRLARPPLNLQQDELLSALVERLMRALHAVRPGSVRQSFDLVRIQGLSHGEVAALPRRLEQDGAASSAARPAAARGGAVRPPRTAPRRRLRGLAPGTWEIAS